MTRKTFVFNKESLTWDRVSFGAIKKDDIFYLVESGPDSLEDGLTLYKAKTTAVADISVGWKVEFETYEKATYLGAVPTALLRTGPTSVLQ